MQMTSVIIVCQILFLLQWQFYYIDSLLICASHASHDVLLIQMVVASLVGKIIEVIISQSFSRLSLTL